jgi:hypothetical protein
MQIRKMLVLSGLMIVVAKPIAATEWDVAPNKLANVRFSGSVVKQDFSEEGQHLFFIKKFEEGTAPVEIARALGRFSVETVRVESSRFPSCPNHEFCDLSLRFGCSDQGFIVQLFQFGFSWFKVKRQSVDHSRTLPAILKVKVGNEKVRSFEFWFLDLQERAVGTNGQRSSVGSYHRGIGRSPTHVQEPSGNDDVRDREQEQGPFRPVWSLPPVIIGLVLNYCGYPLCFLGWYLLDNDRNRRARLYGGAVLIASAVCLGVGGSMAIAGIWW